MSNGQISTGEGRNDDEIIDKVLTQCILIGKTSMKKQIWLAEALSRKERMDERKAAEIADEVRLSQETCMDDNEKGRNERAGNTPGKLENEIAEVAEECQGRCEPEGSTGDSISDGDSNVKRARFDTSENQDVVTQL